MTGYDLTKRWYEFASANQRIVKPVHHALIHWVFQLQNEAKWAEEFELSTQESMEILGISDKHTFLNAYKDLIEFGFIQVVQESTGRYVKRWISLTKCTIYRGVFSHGIPHGKDVNHVNFSHGTTHGTPHGKENTPYIIKETIETKETKEATPVVSGSDSKMKAKSFDPLTITLPFQSQAFIETWTDWILHLRQKKKPPTQKAAEMQIKKLAMLPEPEAIATINQSIENNWQGLFELKPENRPKTEKTISATTIRQPVKRKYYDPNAV